MKHKIHDKKDSGNLQEVVDELKQRFGEGAIIRLNEVKKVDVDSIPTGSVSLDLALGVNGIPRGRVVEIFGPESTGKSTLALHICAQAQKKGGRAAFIDVEHALDPDYAKRLGVNIDELLISQPDSGEQALQIVEALVRSGEIDVIIVDSVAALAPKAEIAGEIGDTHIGLQARLMSSALRKITSIIGKSKTVVIFLNQTRMKIGVMWGCLNYKSKVNLADGGTEWIGRMVNQNKKLNVMSYDWQKNKILPREITAWYRNGKTDKFLQITAYKPYGNGKAQFSCTVNHPILTPSGWRSAEDLHINDLVFMSAPFRLSDFQLEVIKGSLMGDGNISDTRNKNSLGKRFRLGHGLKQKNYLLWKASLFQNIESTIYKTKKAI
ncbi:MAG: recombinase RecA, partial [Candidatus Nealsonbacteria bacterium]|nr:recombinase RecA [Candidatus Nealsonbacteria bacterium]